ncbi:MAG: glutamate--tRNA ligase [Candidatus Caldipriscus sp.]|nr:glutamate--tRNA ligase [Candidatus Caldipriscus sp.]
MVVTRFAPSPTGFLHVGGARTCIYNYLYARAKGGKFLLRIEDTDRSRYKEEWVEGIIRGLKWLGIEWDEPEVYQSQRLEIYRDYANKLIEMGYAYRCFCTEEELEEERKLAELLKKPYRYSRKCLFLSREEIEKNLKEGKPYSIRFKVPDDTDITFEDLVHGSITYNTRDLGGDFVIIKSDGFPTYNFAVVIDDHLMGITHVIRGDDHIANTPKQILIYRAFGWEIPKFAHLSMILGPDRQKLSKRHGATSLEEFRRMGILPEALFNYLVLLGWSPGDNREIVSKEEMIKLFDIAKVNKNPAVFDYQKLLWMNSEYIRMMEDERLLEVLKEYNEYLKDLGEGYEVGEEYLPLLIKLFKDRVKTLRDFFDYGVFVYREDFPYDPEAVKSRLSQEGIFDHLRELGRRFENIEVWKAEEIERVLRGYADEVGVKHAVFIHAVRVAVSGTSVGPSLFHMLEYLGKERVVRRLKEAEKRITSLK